MENTISLGEVMQRVAASIRKDLMDLLVLTAKSDPEINTMAMTKFVSRTRRKVLQLLAAIRWLATPRTQRIMEALNTYYFNLKDFEHRCNAATAEIHFLHSRIYSMRSPVPLVKDAFQLMKGVTVTGSLPSAVFLCGRKQFPEIRSEFSKELTLAIRMRIFQENASELWKNELKANLCDGVLCIEHCGLYALSCTLTTSDVNSPWRLLQYSINSSQGFDKYYKRREEHTLELINIAKDWNPTNIRELTSKAFHHSILNRFADYADKFNESRKSLQPVQVIQDIRKGLHSFVVVFGAWKSDFSRQYQYHFIASLDYLKEGAVPKLSFFVATVQEEDYRIDYSVSNLLQVSTPIPFSIALHNLFVKGASIGEVAQELVVPIIELKLKYLLLRFPNFPPNMNVRFELDGQSLLMYSGSYRIALQLDSISGRFYFNITSSSEKEIHGNLQNFLLEANSVEVEKDFGNYFLAHCKGTLDEAQAHRPLTTVDLVVAYLKTMDLNASMISSVCQPMSSVEDRSLQFQYATHNLFAKFWRRNYYVCDLSSESNNIPDTATVSTGAGTHVSAIGMQHRLRKKSDKIIFMSYYGYLIRPDFSVVILVNIRRLFVDSKRMKILEIEHVESSEQVLPHTTHLADAKSASDESIRLWTALESSLWNSVTARNIILSRSVPTAIGFARAVSRPAALQSLLVAVSDWFKSRNIELWALRIEPKELTIAMADPWEIGRVDVAFSSASTTALMLQTPQIATEHSLQSIFSKQVGMYATSKVFATLSVRAFKQQRLTDGSSTLVHCFRIEKLKLLSGFTDIVEGVRVRKQQQAKTHIQGAVQMIAEHYVRKVADNEELLRLEHLRPMLLTIRAMILLFSVCLMDIQQVKAHWSFAKHALQLLTVSMSENEITWAFRWNKDPNADGDEEPSPNGNDTNSQSCNLLLGYMSASMFFPDNRNELPSITFVEIRHNRTLTLSVEDISLVNVADFFNMDRFDDT